MAVGRPAVDTSMSSPTSEMVANALGRLFPPPLQTMARAELDRYGTSGTEAEIERVRLAILKVSDGDLGRLAEGVALAKRDYRDVLAVAEYPAEFSRPGATSEADLMAARAADRAQYSNWLARFTR